LTTEKTTTYLEFDDNALLIELFGPHEIHLKRVENDLGVEVVARGNRLVVTGPEIEVQLAGKALGQLYQRLKQGHSVDESNVHSAIQMARQGSLSEEAFLTTKRRVIGARSSRQADYIKAMKQNEMVFGLGPAGTGKTYLAVAYGVELMLSGQVDRLILSRPAVEAGEKLGFLPGDMRDKVDPYLRPLYDALHDMLPLEQVTKKLALGEIEVAPLAFMRGRTLSDSIIILDEAQNTTAVQMKMFLTRLGYNSRMIITGDMSQVDLPAGTKSGLADAYETLNGVNGIDFIQFTDEDVVRHPLVARIVRAYDKKTPTR